MRLIDADALLDLMDEKCDYSKPFDMLCNAVVHGAMSEQPTIDAEPVRHGHWIYHVDEIYPSESTQECSACHSDERMSIRHDLYCPNCGAKMDEEDNHA